VIVDCHGHCSVDGSCWVSADDLVKGMDLYGIDVTCCSAPITSGEASPSLVRQTNDLVLASMKRHPDRIWGYCFVNPGFGEDSLREMERCVLGEGMIGVKLYHQYKIDDPVQFPVIERCIEWNVPILMHAGFPSAPELRERQPRLSRASDFVNAAHRYPEALLICAHIGGGGDWERQLKGLREAPSVYLDTGGSVIDAGMIERCVRELGAERLLFACDGNAARGLGKILDAKLSRRQREAILGRNALKLLERRTA